MKIPSKRNLLTLLCLGLGTVLGSAAMLTPAQLQKRLADAEPLTVVDIRSTLAFRNGHIPGAINVPAALIPLKKLPPLGKVVVCGEGLGRDAAEAAAADLNKKPGLMAEILMGGFAGWESAQGATTKPAGMRSETLPVITYQQLKAAPKDDLVLVDLRQSRKALQSIQTQGNPALQPPLTDLRQKFPSVPITSSPLSFPRVTQSIGPSAGVPPLLVLIDNADGSAQEMARMLKANGLKRVVILAGGEAILARDGQPGLQRMGLGQGSQSNAK